MLIELERQTILIEQQLLNYVSKQAHSLLPLAKEYVHSIAKLPAEERVTNLAEISTQLLQLKKRAELQAEWAELKQLIMDENHPDITESMLAIIGNNLDQWLVQK